MHQFAMSLIWGVYEDGKLTDTFRYMEDGAFNTVDGDEYVLPEHAKIGLVHPVELDGDTLDGWKQQLEDYSPSPSSPGRFTPSTEARQGRRPWRISAARSSTVCPFPARYYGEIVHQLTRATASSTDTNENWRTEKHE